MLTDNDHIATFAPSFTRAHIADLAAKLAAGLRARFDTEGLEDVLADYDAEPEDFPTITAGVGIDPEDRRPRAVLDEADFLGIHIELGSTWAALAQMTSDEIAAVLIEPIMTGVELDLEDLE